MLVQGLMLWGHYRGVHSVRAIDAAYPKRLHVDSAGSAGCMNEYSARGGKADASEV